MDNIWYITSLRETDKRPLGAPQLYIELRPSYLYFYRIEYKAIAKTTCDLVKLRQLMVQVGFQVPAQSRCIAVIKEQ